MKLAHFSDLHICTLHRNENIQFTRDTIEYALKEGCDHIVITGDLSHKGLSRDYEILRGLLEEYNLLDPDKLSLTIGNHDIFGGVQLAEDIVTFPQNCRMIQFNQRVNHFVEFFKESFDNTHRIDPRYFFPFAKTVQDIVFFGINSSIQYSIFKNPMASNGEVSNLKRKLLNDLISSENFQNKLKIVLIHHHFYKFLAGKKHAEKSWWDRIEHQTMKLYKKKKLLKLFVNHGVGLVLHGHVHEFKHYEKRGVVFLNGAGCFADKQRHNLEINIIYTSGKDFEIERHRFLSSRKTRMFSSA